MLRVCISRTTDVVKLISNENKLVYVNCNYMKVNDNHFEQQQLNLDW